MKIMEWVDLVIIPFLLTITAGIGAVIVYAVVAGVVAFGAVAGAALACQMFGFDLFAWIGGL